MAEGIFIVIYGINNLGKSTQAEKLAAALTAAGLPSEHIKYPIYDLEPTGPRISNILRSGEKNEMTEEEFQGLYIKNRFDYQPQLIKKISEGVNVVAEDYVGTGLAWGSAKGADLEKLIEANRGLLKPDVAILLDGERFLAGREANHLHEGRDELMDQCRAKHLELAARFGWEVVDANQSVEEVQADILAAIQGKIEKIMEVV